MAGSRHSGDRWLALWGSDAGGRHSGDRWPIFILTIMAVIILLQCYTIDNAMLQYRKLLIDIIKLNVGPV